MIKGFKPIRYLAAAAGLGAASLFGAIPANAGSLAPNLAPNAPSAVYKVTNAELDLMLQQLGNELDRVGPFDFLGIANDHCYPRASQLPAADQTIAFFKKYNITTLASETPDKFQKTFVERLLANEPNVEAIWTKRGVGALKNAGCDGTGLSKQVVGELQAQGEITAIRKMNANRMFWVASDYSWRESNKYEDDYGNITDPVKFAKARLNEKKAAEELVGALDGDRIAFDRGYRHLLQYDPNGLTAQFAAHGKRVVTVAFDYTGHDVSDELAKISREGHKAIQPQIVWDWAKKKVYAWRKPDAQRSR